MLEPSTVRDRLDPVLVPFGFAPGQVSLSPAGDGQAIFCASLDDLVERLPGLPQVTAQSLFTGACVDVVIELEDGCIVRADLEDLRLYEVLRRVGLADAADSVNEVLGQPGLQALAVVESELSRLLKLASSPLSPDGQP